MEEVLSGSVNFVRTLTAAVGAFALVALLLVALGLYGLLAHQVARRRHEFGVRMALGAASSDVFRLVMRRGMGLVVTGILIGGSLLALAALYGPRPFIPVQLADPSTAFPLQADFLAVVGALAFLIVVASMACLEPARRAVAVDPMTALKAD
jgi:ABC-type antimicrobial peptide transport system permease subunit